MTRADLEEIPITLGEAEDDVRDDVRDEPEEEAEEEAEATASESEGTSHASHRLPISQFGRQNWSWGHCGLAFWKDVVRWASHHQEREEKNGPGFVPALMQRREPPEDQIPARRHGCNAHRSNKDIRALYLLVLDLDDGTPLDDLRPRLEPYEWVAYTTHSHTEAKPKYRVIVLLACPVPAAAWGNFWYSAVAHLTGRKLVVDAQAKDPARFYFWPACPPEECTAAWSEHHPGEPLDPATVPYVAAPGREPREGAGNSATSGDGPIAEGGRNRALYRLACLWRGRGMPEEALAAALWVVNERRCIPPLDQEEVAQITESAARHEPNENLHLGAIQEGGGEAHQEGGGEESGEERGIPSDETASLGPDTAPWTDLGNAERLAARHAGWLRETLQWGWLAYNTKSWQRNAEKAATRRLCETIRAAHKANAHDIDGEEMTDKFLKFLRRSENAGPIAAALKIAAALPSISAEVSDFDRHPHLFNAANGTMDLRTGILRPHDPADMLTQITHLPIILDAQAPRWERFLDEVFAGNRELIEFLQRAVGYSLTGDVREETLFFFSGDGANGKALSAITPLPTPTGWTTMGEVQVGDELLDEQGQPCVITRATGVMLNRPCYRVKFWGGGEIIADADHQWLVRDHKPKSHGKRNTRRRDKEPHVLTTAQMLADLEAPNDCRFRYSIDIAEPLQLPAADLPIDPYVLGVWLGDGHSGGATVSNPDNQIRQECEVAGYQTTNRKQSGCPVYGIGIKGQGWDKKSQDNWPLQMLLRHLGLLNNKHVPAAYLRGSVEQRLALLQGLMDTDGYIAPSHGQCEFSNTNPLLRDAVLELARSLGLRPTCKTVRARLNGKDYGKAYRVQFHGYADMPCFRLERKRAHLTERPTRGRRVSGRWIIEAIEPIPSVPVRCVQVNSPSHLYLAGEAMVPTHNTTFLETIAYVLGDYACPAPPNLLMASRSERHPTEIACLRGKRFVVVSETKDGSRLDEEKIKVLVSSEPLTARFMHRDFFTFTPTHKLWLTSNYRPIIRGTDTGIWRRLPLIPFNVSFRNPGEALPGEPVKDPALKEYLRECEAVGILAWAVRGARTWYTDGLRPPAIVLEASREYREDMDWVGQFLAECAREDESAITAAAAAYAAYRDWAARQGEQPRTQTAFGEFLAKRGFQKVRNKTRRAWRGFALRSQSEIFEDQHVHIGERLTADD